jgi:hypothetical protein
MKYLTLLIIACFSIATYGQDKYNYVHFNKLTEVVGTEYVIASIENWGKMSETKSKYLLFIDTKTGASTQIDFPIDASIGKLEQVKLDNLGINVILVSARTVYLDGKSGIDLNDPTQIIVLSPDGKQKTQLIDDKFFARTWVVNNITGTIVITGHYDTNNNGKYDKTDKNEIHTYDLKTLKLVAKI